MNIHNKMFICCTIKQEVRQDYTVLNIALTRILESFDLGIALLIYNPHAHGTKSIAASDDVVYESISIA